MPKRQPSELPAPSARTHKQPEVALTISEMAAATGTTLRTVRFYEQEGLIATSQRTIGRHRRFESAQLLRLRAVLELRSAGLSLEQIRALMAVRGRHVRGALASRELGEALGVELEALQLRLRALKRVKVEFEGAQARLAECQNCRDDARFMRHCEGCETLSRNSPYSPFVRLLWSGKP